MPRLTHLEYFAIEFIDNGLICTIIVGTSNSFPNGLSYRYQEPSLYKINVCQSSSIGGIGGYRLNTFTCDKTIFVFFSHKDLNKLGP
ncbi:hypothetical protein ACOSP7_019687 [Xanthoceras sorbifolium]